MTEVIIAARSSVAVKASYARAEHTLNIERIIVSRPAQVYLRFEVWSETAGQAVPLPQGTPVDLVDDRGDGTTQTILTEATDPSGRAHFAFDLEALDRREPNIAFIVRPAIPPGDGAAGIWSSKERKAINGKPGFYPAYNGDPIGSAAAPLTFSMPVSASFYVQFEIWDLNNKRFVALPEQIPVDLVNYNPLISDEVLDTKVTDGEGRVEFHIPDVSALAEPRPDLYFLVRPGDQTYAAGHELPERWSTKGWMDKDGARPGYYPDFKGGTNGSPDAPMVYRIGLDVHLAIRYDKKRSEPKPGVPAPPGVLVNICRHDSNLKKSVLASLRTDKAGEVHGVIFNARGDDTILVEVVFESEIVFQRGNEEKKLPKSKVSVKPWMAATFANNRYTSLPWSSSSPMELCARTENRNVALYFLKILRELQVFFYHITNGGTDGAWTGFDDLTIHTDTILLSENSSSWPVGSVWIAEKDHWVRPTIVHELTHQVVWKQAHYFSFGIAFKATLGNLHAREHRLSDRLNEEHALIEGWPAFMEAVFNAELPKGAIQSAAKPPDSSPENMNTGECVEGAFALGLYGIFRTHVLEGEDTTTVLETESDGDITTCAPWVTNAAVQARFLSMIWKPLGNLQGDLEPTTTQFLEQVRQLNGSRWHELCTELHPFFMARKAPKLERITPASGAHMGVYKITMFGSDFVTGAMVTFGGNGTERDATSINVKSHAELEANTPPLEPGRYDVTVITSAGRHVLREAYTSI